MPSQPIAEQFGSVIAKAMDEGMTEVEIVAEVKRMAAMESDRRTQETARKLYGPARAENHPETTRTTPEAAAIVARHKLPGGKYGIETTHGDVQSLGSAFAAVATALATGEEHRLYRNGDGWRFIGIVHADGRFTDERAWGTDPRDWS